jgi:hypothetical protein
VSARASSTLASTDRAEGRSTAAGTVRVATSIIPVSSTLPGTPSSSMTSTSSGVESISISSPGAAGLAWENIRCGRPASPRRVAADPVVCLPADSRENSRNIVARDGSVPASPRSARSSRVRHMMNVAVRDDWSVASAIACSIASATTGPQRPAGLRRRVARLSTSPGSPSACHRCRLCLTVEAATGLPGTDSSTALASSRWRRLVCSTS